MDRSWWRDIERSPANGVTIEQMEGRQEVVSLFWEQLPASAQLIGTVPVGSKVTANISPQANSEWLLSFQITEPNGTVINKQVTTTLTSNYAAGIGTSAQWINEDPSNGDGQLYPLANTDVVSFTGAEANNRPLNSSSFTVSSVALVNQAGNPLIAPSVLGTDGESFTTKAVTSQSVRGWGGRSARHFSPRVRAHFGNFHFGNIR